MPRKQGLIYKYKNPCSKTNMKQTHFIHQNKSYKATVNQNGASLSVESPSTICDRT